MTIFIIKIIAQLIVALSVVFLVKNELPAYASLIIFMVIWVIGWSLYNLEIYL